MHINSQRLHHHTATATAPTCQGGLHPAGMCGPGCYGDKPPCQRIDANQAGGLDDMTDAWDTYALLRDPVPTETLQSWPVVRSRFSAVVGYSGLGHIFLRSEASEYAVLHPFRTAYKSYGHFGSCTAFENTVLRDTGFARYVLQTEHQQAIRALLGPLEADEVYIPSPYPCMGGDERPENYDRGDVWVFLDIVGQMLN